MKFEKEKINVRLALILGFFFVVCIIIFGKLLKTMTIDSERWKDISEQYVKDSVVIKPARGNVLSADGQLMSTSLPDHKVFLDFVAGDSLKDSLFMANIDTICNGLHEIIPEWTSEQFKQHLLKGRNGRKRYYPVYPWRISYIQCNELRKLPLFNEKNKYFSGLIVEDRNNRKKPFGSLAKRTLGEMYGAKDSARSGIELAYDSILRGENGFLHRQKVKNKYLGIIDQPPVDGSDVITTIDVDMQDICESALREELHEINASMGVVVLMEVKTGDVKAIVNLQQYDDGNYYESVNYALASLMEPGSTFKTASILVALDDNKITIDDKVDTRSGVYPMYGRLMKDHNWISGGYHVIDVPHVLMYSSNVGVSRLIDENYHKNPEQFVEGLYRVGIGQPLHLPFAGSANPKIRKPTKDNWSATTLAWMSIGYETQIPPISTVAFYNAIANNGKMVQPRFVKAVQKDGKIIQEYPVVVLKEKICSDHALKDIQTILERVVSEGLGRRAGNPHFHVSGKTGTAQVSQGKAGYHSARREYLVSFCGYYPSENPQYTCVVAIRKPGLPASGGLMAGSVFAKIAARVYAKNITTDISLATDTLHPSGPFVKKGSLRDASIVLSHLDFDVSANDQKSKWGKVENNDKKCSFVGEKVESDKMPDLTGMGARDAVFIIERSGMKARVEGMGRVYSQSVAPGSAVVKGKTVVISLK
jgi:cell division protein FtsI (penicillin-binding protein 3)